MTKDELAFIISTRIRALRKRHGLTQAALAEKIGMSVESICHLESGKKLTKLTTLLEIAMILEVEVYQLLTDRPEIAYEEFSSDITELLLELQDRDEAAIRGLLQFVKSEK